MAPKRKSLKPANDNEETPQIRAQGLDGLPLTVAEVEIFDALISNIRDLTAANDNKPASDTENRS